MPSSQPSSPKPTKSQPLHYFSLPKQWFLGHATNSQIFSTTTRGDGGGRSSSSSQHSPSRTPKATWRRRPRAPSNAAPGIQPHRPSRLADLSRENPQLIGLFERETSCAALLQSGLDLNKDKKIVASSTVQDEFPTSSSGHNIETKLMALALSSTDDKIKEKMEYKIEMEVDVVKKMELKSIGLPLKNKVEEVKNEEKESKEEDKKSNVELQDDGFIEKTWNLRPRRSVQMPSDSKSENKTLMLEASGGCNGANANKKKEKGKEKVKWPKLSIELSREEIEEDLVAMTGKWPLRKPKTRSRAKAVQKQPDNLFPGSYLGLITPDRHKDHDKVTESLKRCSAACRENKLIAGGKL